ncbi:MAG: MBOAT family protein [Clostridia bacterium]|nr:MBOAT family protein [Clostridia bacterium]
MVFSSNIFLFAFLPVTLAGYYLINQRLRNAFLLLMSLLFYAWGEPRVVLVMMGSIIINYLGGLAIHATMKDGRHSFLNKLIMFLTVAVNLLILFYYKYFDFFITTTNGIFGTSIPLRNIVLPIGISFFTFQGMSYVLDVFMGHAGVQKNPLNIALYIALFPQLIAGPIVRYADVNLQIDNRSCDIKKFAEGIRRFAVGLVKKMLLANTAALTADSIFNEPVGTVTTAAAWLGALCYAVQIYFDFCGYSDMAIGLGKMFGFDFLENFNYPYIARNITDFWRRWHISLSSWFRDYVYIPLGGNRRGNRYFNLSVVFLLTGMWHGASWNYILWGIWHGIFSIVEKPLLKRDFYKKVPYPITWLFTMLIVLIGWVLFRLENLSEALKYLGVMFGAVRPDNVAYTFEWFFNGKLAAVLACAVLASVPWKNILGHIPALKRFGDSSFCHLLQNAATVALLLLGVVLCMTSTYNPFIYFRF